MPEPYQPLKAAVLAAAAVGRLPMVPMEAALEQTRALRRMLQ